jgi:hypothetical protein
MEVDRLIASRALSNEKTKIDQQSISGKEKAKDSKSE